MASSHNLTQNTPTNQPLKHVDPMLMRYRTYVLSMPISQDYDYIGY